MARRKPPPSSSAARRCKRCARCAIRGREWSITSGVDGLTILKTTKSAFTGYIKDKLTTLKPATDRIFGTRATVTWDYAAATHGLCAGARARIVAALLKEFAAHDSMSVQHTLFDMGKAALDAAPEIARIHAHHAQPASPACRPEPLRPGQSQPHLCAHR